MAPLYFPSSYLSVLYFYYCLKSKFPLYNPLFSCVYSTSGKYQHLILFFDINYFIFRLVFFLGSFPKMKFFCFVLFCFLVWIIVFSSFLQTFKVLEMPRVFLFFMTFSSISFSFVLFDYTF